MKHLVRLIICIGISFLGSDRSSAQTQPVELIEQACPSTESLPHPCWAIEAKTDQVVIHDVTIEGGDCALAQGLNLPTELKRGEALSIVTGLCTLGDVTIQTDRGDWRFAP
jgi:hypothetical protein